MHLREGGYEKLIRMYTQGEVIIHVNKSEIATLTSVQKILYLTLHIFMRPVFEKEVLEKMHPVSCHFKNKNKYPFVGKILKNNANISY